MDFFTREFMLLLFYLAAVRLQDVCLYGYECLTDPRLYKVDHCCLSLSRALAVALSFSSLGCFLSEKQLLCS